MKIKFRESGEVLDYDIFMVCVPRINEKIFIGNKVYLVIDVEYIFDGYMNFKDIIVEIVLL